MVGKLGKPIAEEGSLEVSQPAGKVGGGCNGSKNGEKGFYIECLGMATDGNMYRTTLEDLPSPHLSEWVLEVGSTGGASQIFPGQSSRFHNIIQCFFQITALHYINSSSIRYNLSSHLILPLALMEVFNLAAVDPR